MPLDEKRYLDGLPRLEIDGAEDEMAADLLVSMEMTESDGGMSSLELCFDNAAQVEGKGGDMPFETDANDKLSLGAEIRVVAGDTHDPQEIFKGQITGLELIMDGEATPQLVVLAEDALQKARMARRTRTYEAGNIEDIVNEIAQEHGLTVVSSGLDQEHYSLAQANETDLGFLRRLCAQYDIDFQVVGTELHIAPRGDVSRGVKTLEFGETLTSFRALADLSDQVSFVTISGWDHQAYQDYTAVSMTGSYSGPGEDRKSDTFLEADFSPRFEHIAEITVEGFPEGINVANALLSARQRRFVSVEATATGDPALRVGTTVEIKGVGPRFENSYYVTHAQHHYSRSDGYLTDFRAESAFFGG